MSTFKLPSFIKLPRNRRFGYKPLYYNEAQEEMKKRYNSAKKELGINSDNPNEHNGDVFREKLKSRWNRNSYGKGAANANYRVFLVLFVIVAVLWYIFK